MKDYSKRAREDFAKYVSLTEDNLEYAHDYDSVENIEVVMQCEIRWSGLVVSKGDNIYLIDDISSNIEINKTANTIEIVDLFRICMSDVTNCNEKIQEQTEVGLYALVESLISRTDIVQDGNKLAYSKSEMASKITEYLNREET